MIDTSKVQDRRRLRFDTVDHALADVERIVASDKAGKLRRTGNWSAGQAFGHLATWINYGYDGYPFKTPWLVRAFLRLMKKKYINSGMDAGVHIPKAAGGTFGTEELSTEEGASRLKKALLRLKAREPARYDSPAWGKLTDDERVALNLRHAELHMSFLHP